MPGIIRTPTDTERKDFIPLAGVPARNPEDEFNRELGKHKAKAIKEGRPYADKAARIEFEEYYEKAKKDNIKKNGYLKPEEIKPFKPDFEKYGKIENFELLEEGEQYDEHLSARHHIPVYLKKRKYRYKGYFHTYVIMEDPQKAIERARKALK